MATEEAVKQATQAPTWQEEAKRERVHSSIVFPYSDLDDAVGVAKSVYTIGGSSCQADQLAARLGLPVSASMFQLRLNTARIFGLIVYSQGTITLTPLGTRICDRQQESAARAESFLSVPLYKAVYEQFKGATLPPPGGLDTTIGNMGVSPKQKEKARRVFQRSASQAGFFAFGQDRLVYPSMKGNAEPPPSGNGEIPSEKNEKDKNSHDGGGGGDGTRHPLIEGLIKALPEGGADWPLESRKKWLQAAAMNFAFVYIDSKRDSSDDQESIKVSIERESSAK
jgi:hypothetical protein